MPSIKIVNLSKRYGKITANDNINLNIENGEYVSVIGPSGCGKTTLIKNIAGIIDPDEGEIYIGDQLVKDFSIEDRGIGYVFQDIALFPHLNVWDNITYGPNIKGWPQEETRLLANEMLELIKVTARSDSYPAELSGGTQQKTAVARALTSRAELLLFDEPLGALDVKVRTKLRFELRRLVKDLGLTALHVTHDQEEAMAISDRVIVMKSGRIIEFGTPISLYTKPKNIFTANFVGEANFLEGNVAQIKDEGSLIDVGNNLTIMTNRRDLKVGEKKVLAFRPEFTTLVNRQSIEKNTNNLQGEVTETLYSGSILRIRIKLINDNQILIKTVVIDEKSMLNVDDKITINISPRNILIYSYPEGGLDEELALE